MRDHSLADHETMMPGSMTGIRNVARYIAWTPSEWIKVLSSAGGWALEQLTGGRGGAGSAPTPKLYGREAAMNYACITSFNDHASYESESPSGHGVACQEYCAPRNARRPIPSLFPRCLRHARIHLVHRLPSHPLLTHHLQIHYCGTVA